MVDKSKLRAVMLGGALGDALGAPAEMIFNQQKIFELFGPRGVEKLHDYRNTREIKVLSGVGAITDDTTMALTTLAAMVMAHQSPEKLAHYTWQSYLNWGAAQDGGEKVAPHISPTLEWPSHVRAFWFGTGAGRGTMAALATGRRGSIEEPLAYNTVIRDKAVIGPNNGCGGMMRVAPLAFWPHESDKMKLGMENSAITHGAVDAYRAGGFVCDLVATTLELGSITQAFNRVMIKLDKASEVYRWAEAGWQKASADYSLQGINALPGELGEKNKFLALPVLGQVAYSLAASEQMKGSVTERFRHTLTLAVSHSGDSDSVGAIVGNVLGAAYGEKALPQDWLSQLQLRREMETLCDEASVVLLAKSSAPRP